MSFYKNTRCEISEWKQGADYPIGTLIRYKEHLVEITSTREVGFWFGEESCKTHCVLFEVCKRLNYVNMGSVITRCTPTYRDDFESVYFKKISLNIEK